MQKRTVNTSALDEDPGEVLIGKADIHTPVYMLRKDEVYASVTMSTASVAKQSATVKSGIWV